MSLVQPVFGGAIQVEIPGGMLDASEFRQVPDNQEVFVVGDAGLSLLGPEDSLIVELMEMVEPQDDEKAVAEHIKEISELNGVLGEWKRVDQVGAPGTFPGYVVTVTEPAMKWGRDNEGVLVLVLGIVRLHKVTTDVLVSLNLPVSNDQDVAAREQTGQAVVAAAIRSLAVKDWGLFGE